MTWPIVLLIAGLMLVVYWAASRKAPARRAPRRAGRAARAPAPRPRSVDEADGDITLITDRASLMARVDAEAGVPEPAPASTVLLTDIVRATGQSGLDDDPQDADEAQESRALLMYEAEAVDDEGTGPVARVLVWAQGDSDQGRRRQRNEDAFLVLPEQAVFAVADGVGGYEGGQLASALAVDALRRTFTVEQPPLPPLDPRLPRRGGEMADAMLAANRAVFDAARANVKLSNMGTTLVAARFALDKQRLYLGHVGDSRCYRLRAQELRQLTTDHTMEQLGFVGPRAKDLTRAIGMERYLEVDLVVDKPCVDDVYLLCSDGLTKMVDDGDIRDIILAETDIEAAVYSLIERANEAGGRDNVTVLLVKVLSAGQPAHSNPAPVAVPV